MPVPRRSRDVTAAAAASPTNGSSVCEYSLGRVPPPGHGLRRLVGMWVCSVTNRDSKPRASRARARSSMRIEYSVGKMKAPTCMPCLLERGWMTVPRPAPMPSHGSGATQTYSLTVEDCQARRRSESRDSPAGGAAENGAVAVQEPRDARTREDPRRVPMRLGSPVRVALTVLTTALLAIVAPAPGEAKVLRTNLRADPAMVDPITYSELVAGDVMKNLYEGFTEIDRDGNIVPTLALRWEASSDNKGFRFYLRKGVKFHSGREFTAKDVKWTFEQILLPGNKGGLTLTYLKILEGAQDILDGKTTQLSGVKVI